MFGGHLYLSIIAVVFISPESSNFLTNRKCCIKKTSDSGFVGKSLQKSMDANLYSQYLKQ